MKLWLLFLTCCLALLGCRSESTADPGAPLSAGPTDDGGGSTCACKTGAVGPEGARGAKGDRGAPGIDGAPGAPGADGSVGPQGGMGGQGEKGDKGSPGSPGSQGDKGATGSPGSPGAPGAAGAPGAKGDKGDPGTAVERADVYVVTGSAVVVAPSVGGAVTAQTAMVACQHSSDILLSGGCGIGPSNGFVFLSVTKADHTTATPRWICEARNGSAQGVGLTATAYCLVP